MKKLIFCSFLLGFFLITTKFTDGEESYVKVEPVKNIKIIRQLTEEESKEINRIFGKKATIATAVLKHESGLKVDAVNHNCRYNGKSTFCKKGDTNIISSDCGLGQINIKTKNCPAELLTSQGNLKAIEKIYKAQGLTAWVSFKSGAYRKFL